MKTTLNQIRYHSPCADGWKKLLAHLGKTAPDDEPLALTTILDSNGLDDALWCLRAVAGHDREKRLLAVAFARRVQHLMTDPRSIAALDVAERYAHGQATDEELIAARVAAWDEGAACGADAAWAACDACAAWAARAAWAVCEDAYDAVARAAADPSAERLEQEKILREMLSTTN